MSKERARSADLVQLRAGRAALERARATGEIREIKRIGDAAAAARQFAQAQKLSEESRRFATELELDANRALGEVLADTPKNPGAAVEGWNAVPTGDRVAEVLPPPALKDLGVSKRQSSEAQQLAAIPEPEYERFKASTPTDKLTKRGVLRAHRDQGAAPVSRRDPDRGASRLPSPSDNTDRLAEAFGQLTGPERQLLVCALAGNHPPGLAVLRPSVLRGLVKAGSRLTASLRSEAREDSSRVQPAEHVDHDGGVA